VVRYAARSQPSNGERRLPRRRSVCSRPIECRAENRYVVFMAQGQKETEIGSSGLGSGSPLPQRSCNDLVRGKNGA